MVGINGAREIKGKPSWIFFTQQQLGAAGQPVSPQTVRVNLKRWVKDLAEGDGIVLYVADNTPVYEKDGCQVLNGYLALEIRKGSDGDE